MKIGDLIIKNENGSPRFGTIIEQKTEDDWAYYRITWHEDIEFVDEVFIRQYDKLFKSKPKEVDENGNLWHRASELHVIDPMRLYLIGIQHKNTLDMMNIGVI